MAKKSKKQASPTAVSPIEPNYELTETRKTAIAQQVAAQGGDLIAFPGRLDQRIRWSTTIRLAAIRDASDLVLAPFPDGDAMLTHEEIAAQRDYIEYLRLTGSRFQALRSGQPFVNTEFDVAAQEAAAHKELLLRAFDLRFANDPKGQKRLSAIRAGNGDADLVQDVSDLVVLANEEKAFLAKCPRGEAAAAARLEAISPMLSDLLGKKGMSEDALKARRLRDGAYTLVMRTERRFRSAADYWYRGTDKVKDYAPFTAPASSDEEPVDGEAPIDGAAPDTGKADK